MPSYWRTSFCIKVALLSMIHHPRLCWSGSIFGKVAVDATFMALQAGSTCWGRLL